MNPVVPRNILILTMMIIVCFFACSMAKKRGEPSSTTLKYEHNDDVSCGAGLNEVCCPVIELMDTALAGSSDNPAKNEAGRVGCRCRCSELLIDQNSTEIAAPQWPAAGYCKEGKGGWVPLPTGSKKAARKYKKL